MRFLGHLLLSWFLNALVLAIVAWTFSDVTRGTTGQLLTAAAIFGILNTILKPILRLITLPFAVITLGLAWFFVSMLMLWITDVLSNGIDVHGFWAYVWATIAIWIVNLIIDIGFAIVSKPKRANA
jgi:putative membrane protein